MTSTPFEPSLRDKVFEICENLYKNSEKITRKKVRDVLGGGSYEYISPLVTEWKNLNSVQNQETESTETEEQSNIVVSQDQSIEQVPEELYATSTNADFLADDDMSTILRSGAEKAASLLMAQEAVTSHFFQNPNELPEDLKQKLKGIRGNFTQARSQAATTAHNPQTMINLVMSKLKKPDDEGLELIG
ncbi:MAG: DNA-binding protein [Aphanizomenon flos-aquae Clear-A1]|jgi:hypothetical protein|nr:DNA-binding protein [Aphanizomenon flos-aquae Clear-A1]